LSSQLSDWPRQELSVRSDLTTEYHRGDIHSNHEFLYPVHTYDTRYQGFSHIPFRRGDVVIFSTRAFHALLPTHTDHYSKLLGLLFIEDFEKSTGRKLNAQVEDMTFDEKEYVTLPFNLRLADNIIKGDDYQTAYKSFANYPMGLQEILASGDPLLAKAFSQHTSIYQFSQAAQLDLFQSCLASKEAVLKTFEKNFHSERDILNRYLQPIDSTMSELATRSAIYTEEITSLASQFLDEMHSTLAASPVLRQSDSNPLAKRLRYKLKQLAKRLLRRS
jgi:hypothetical protein